MPRKYKRPLGVKGRRQYDGVAVENALRAVMEDQVSFRQAAERFNVPHVTIYRKYRGMNSDRLGRPSVLSVVEERKIVAALTTAANYGYPFTELDLAVFVQGYLNRKGVTISVFKDNLPGSDWRRNFMARNRELTIRATENMKRARAALSVEVLNQYFDELHQTIAEIPAANIINYDESNLTDDPGRQRVITRKGVKYATRILDSSKSSTSVMFCAAADGTVLPSYIVYRAKNIYQEWTQDGPEGAHYNRSKSGWFDGELFEDWFFKVAFPYLRRLEGKKVMIGDNLSSHLSLSIITKCNEANIEFKFLPAHSTHLCQPLDISFFRPLKAVWRKNLAQWKLRNKGCIPKSIFPSLLKKALVKMREKENMQDIVKAGFRATGIFPPDRNEVLKKIPGAIVEAVVDEAAINESFRNIIIQNLQFSPHTTTRITRRKKINILPGKSVSVTDFEVIEEENSTTAPKRPRGRPSKQRQIDETSKTEPKTEPTHKTTILSDDEESSSEETIKENTDTENIEIKKNL